MFFNNSKRFEKEEIPPPQPYTEAAISSAPRHTAIGSHNMAFKIVDLWKRPNPTPNNNNNSNNNTTNNNTSRLSQIAQSKSPQSPHSNQFDSLSPLPVLFEHPQQQQQQYSHPPLQRYSIRTSPHQSSPPNYPHPHPPPTHDSSQASLATKHSDWSAGSSSSHQPQLESNRMTLVIPDTPVSHFNSSSLFSRESFLYRALAPTRQLVVLSLLEED